MIKSPAVEHGINSAGKTDDLSKTAEIGVRANE